MLIDVTVESIDLDSLPPPNLVAGLKKRKTQLQMLPAVAIEAMRLAADPNCSLSAYSSIVERDLKLATEILTVTNSAVYNPASAVVGLKQAVVRLGLQRCQNLIMTSSITSMMRRISLEQERICCILWNHSYQTALLAGSLNSTFQFGFHGEEFTAGLIHDIGRTLLAISDSEQFAKCDSMNFDEMPEQLAHEERLIGTDHCRLGAWYANQQHLPAPLPEVIRYHHQPEFATQDPRLTSLIAVADHMANYLQRLGTACGYDPRTNPFVPFLSQFAGPNFEQSLSGECFRVMDKVLRDSEAMNQEPSQNQLLAPNLRETVVCSMFSENP